MRARRSRDQPQHARAPGDLARRSRPRSVAAAARRPTVSTGAAVRRRVPHRPREVRTRTTGELASHNAHPPPVTKGEGKNAVPGSRARPPSTQRPGRSMTTVAIDTRSFTRHVRVGVVAGIAALTAFLALIPSTAQASVRRYNNLATSFCLDSNAAGNVYTHGCNAGAFQRWNVTGGNAVQLK